MSRKELAEKYGTWFSTDVSAGKLLERVSNQLASCEKWVANLKELQITLRTESRTERAAELKNLLIGMTPEELKSILGENTPEGGTV